MMSKQANSEKKRPSPKKDQSSALKGWQKIAAFLGEPVSVIQRWAKEGMPGGHEGRFVISSPEELNEWLRKESGKPVHVATESSDLSSELKRGISFIRHEKHSSQADLGSPRTQKARSAMNSSTRHSSEPIKKTSPLLQASDAIGKLSTWKLPGHGPAATISSLAGSLLTRRACSCRQKPGAEDPLVRLEPNPGQMGPESKKL